MSSPGGAGLEAQSPPEDADFRLRDVEPASPWRFQSLPRVMVARPLLVLGISVALAAFCAWLALTNPPRIAVAMFAGLVGGITILLQPFIGLLAYFTLAYLRPQDLLWGLEGARLSAMVSMSTLAATLVHFAYRPTLRFLLTPQSLLVGTLWLFIWLSTVFGQFGEPGSKWMSYYHKLFLIYYVSLAIMNSEAKMMAILWVIGLSVGYLGIWANQQHYLNGLSIVHGPGEKGATLYDHNDFAMLLVMALPFVWYLMRSAPNAFLRLGLLGLLPLMAHGIMLTFSRGGFLGMCATMATVAVREKNKKLGALMVVGGAVLFLVLAGEGYRDRLSSIDNFKTEKSASGRLEAWEVGARMTKHNPIFGVGLRKFTDAFPYYSNWEPRVAHNSWFQLMAECGLVAVACYGGLVLLTLRALWRIRRREKDLPEGSARLVGTIVPTLEASLVGYLVCGFFLSMEDFEFFYLLVAMAQVLDRVTEVRLAEVREKELEAARATDARARDQAPCDGPGAAGDAAQPESGAGRAAETVPA